jgi:hypothetical protein
MDTPAVTALKEYLKSLPQEAKDELLEYLDATPDVIFQLMDCVHPLSLESFTGSFNATRNQKL